MSKIVHICAFDKFINGFVEFNERNFSEKDHKYFVIGVHEKYPVPTAKNVVINPVSKLKKIKFLLEIIFSISSAERVIIHGLFEPRLIYFLVLQYLSLKKVYWVMWGADLYLSKENRNESIVLTLARKFITSRFGGVVTYIPGDYEYAVKNLGVKGEMVECIMYPSNIYYSEVSCKNFSEEKKLRILVGNSAFSSNNHIEVFERLSKFDLSNVEVWVPLSYGDELYKQNVIAAGNKLLRNSFIPITEFLDLKRYLRLLDSVDIGIFNHKKQQGMGNTINLLGRCKTVYIRSDVTPWQLFSSLGVSLLDTKNLSLEVLPQSILEKNSELISSYFSEVNYLKQLRKLYLHEE